MSEDKFSEEVVRQIIRLAMEKEKEQSTASNKEQGLTLEELISIGKDVGLSEDEIRSAANKYGSYPLKRTFKVTNTDIIEERFFKSDMDKEALWEHIQFELDDHYGESTIFGNLTAPARDYQWKHTSASGVETKATLRSEDDGYRLRISQKVGMGHPVWEGILIGLLFAFLPFGLITGFLEPEGWWNLLTATGSWSVSAFIVYKLDVAWRKKKQRKLKELANTLVMDVLESDSNQSQSQSNDQQTGEIRIEDEDVYSGNQQTSSSSGKSKEMN